MRNLTRLVLLFVLAALGWGVYWWVGARATERAATTWLDARRAEGWSVTAEPTTRGFPNRFDTTFEAIALADPETGTAWAAPWFQILSLSYKPTHVIAVWPPEQQLELPRTDLEIASDRMRASLEMGATPELPWQRSIIELAGLRLTAAQDWRATLAAGQLALRESPGAGDAPGYDVALSLTGLAPESPGAARLRNRLGLPEVIDSVTAEMTVVFDKGWDLGAISDRRPQPRELRITALAARWGNLSLAGSGEISIDPAGTATGKLTLDATNWREIVALAAATGALPEETVPLVTGALETLARLGGDPDRLDVPLTFARGLTLLGPVPIGAAPVIRIP